MPEFEIDNTLGYLLSKANQSMKSAFSRLLSDSNLNITVEQWAVLNIVHNNPGASQSDIARITKTDKANVMRMIDLMEKKKLIRRTSAEKDRRVNRIFLTPDGENMLKTAIPIAVEINQLSLMGISQAEILLLFTLLQKIRTNTE